MINCTGWIGIWSVGFYRGQKTGVPRDQVLLHEKLFFSQCIQQQWSVRQNYFHWSKLPTAACWSWEKREETVKPTCFMSKATSVPQSPQTNHLQCSSFVEALNLIIKSKSQPVELDNLTIELHVLSRRNKSLRSYCSVDFDFLALMQYDDLWCHVAWRLRFR